MNNTILSPSSFLLSSSPKFSIIIPVYNVAPYLRECLDSVLAQTFTDWEAICVDDGSTDGSGEILDEYREKVEKLGGGGQRIVVIHQKNAGVSAARNAALDIARGEWFLFLDSDDCLRKDGLQTIYDLGLTTSVDGILIHPYIPQWNGDVIHERTRKTQVLVPNAKVEDLILGPYAANGFPFSRVYRKEVFGRLRFHLGVKMAEDVLFWFDALQVSARWTIVEAEYYLYRQRADSVCGKRSPNDGLAVYDSILYAFQVIGDCLDLGREGKVQYFERFPGSPYIYNDVFIARYRELDSETRQSFFSKVDSIVLQLGRNPFPQRVQWQLWLILHGFGIFVPFVPFILSQKAKIGRFVDRSRTEGIMSATKRLLWRFICGQHN